MNTGQKLGITCKWEVRVGLKHYITRVFINFNLFSKNYLWDSILLNEKIVLLTKNITIPNEEILRHPIYIYIYI